MGKFIDITGQTFGNWSVLSYNKELKQWLCECNCEKHTKKYISSADLRRGKTTNCGCKRKKDLTGQQFGHLIVDNYAGEYHWNCHCVICNRQFNIHTYHLEHNNIPACNHNDLHTNVVDITGKQFNDWTVLSYAGNKYWNCRCSCGIEKKVLGKALRTGTSKSCGHNSNKFIDLTGMTFGYWTVIKYTNNGSWLCKCSCGSTKNVLGESLIIGESKSCGCKSKELTTQTMLSRYGDIATSRTNKPREMWQIQALNNIDNLISVIKTFDNKPTILELEKKLDSNKNTILRRIHKWELEEYIELYNYKESNLEKEVYLYIESIYNGKITRHDRKILHGKELDIYMPEKKLAIEFNGTHWHCDELVDKKYHQNKTIECIKNNIQLIHIFEYEWVDNNKQKLIKNLIKDRLCSNIIYYARQLDIKYTSKGDEVKFLNNYHLQGYVASETAIGLYHNNELLGIMTFGKPRFNGRFDCELLRMCFKTGVNIVGGSEKLLKHYINKHKPKGIVSYCDLSKFSGNSYIRLGFKTDKSMLTQPNYVWVSTERNEKLSRYQTQKSKLIKNGLGTYGNTESEIMRNLNYLRVYDSGNMRFEMNLD